MRILYIDDDPINRRIMHKIARTANCELQGAANVREGLARLAEKPDLILTDARLPDINGLALIRQIRQISPAIPVVVVTAHALSADRQDCLEAGCTDYIAKPFHFEEMVAYLKRYETNSGSPPSIA